MHLSKRSQYPASVRKLINEFSKLPSIGEKTATRLAYHVVVSNKEYGQSLSSALKEACEKVSLCQRCFSLAEDNLCEICGDDSRLSDILCVVEKPSDVIAVERSGKYEGKYHVLHGLWSPMRGGSTESTRIPELIERVTRSKGEETQIKELIVATSSTVEGDATALYIASELEPTGVEVTRLAQGMPIGGELEYADQLTLTHAFEGRRRL